MKENPRALWTAGILGGSVLVVGGIWYLAARKPSGAAGSSGSSACTNWTKASGSQATSISSGLNLGSVGPGTYYYTWQGTQVKFVNNMDGSNNTDPDTPSGNTSIYVCSS